MTSLPRRGAALAAGALLLITACAPTEESESDGGSDGGTDAASCEAGALPTLEDGTLTIGTDSPAYDPWFSDDDPTNGKGFESAVAYAVADRLGYAKDDVTWVTVPFNSSYQPGPKTFDFDINQVSITDERAQAVDFSEPYYRASQAIVVVEGSPIAGATSFDDLADAQLGAQTGTTSLQALESIDLSKEPRVYNDNNTATQALQNGQIDGLVMDLPTAFYTAAAVLDDATVIGQFEPDTGESEAFGLLLAKDSELTSCVDEAVTALQEDGTLADLEEQWLSQATGVPELS